MSNIQIIQGGFEKELKLQFAPSIKAGFPSPAQDYLHESLDFNRDLIRNPEATFYGRQVESTSRMFRCGRRPRYWNPSSRMSVSVWYSSIA